MYQIVQLTATANAEDNANRSTASESKSYGGVGGTSSGIPAPPPTASYTRDLSSNKVKVFKYDASRSTASKSPAQQTTESIIKAGEVGGVGINSSSSGQHLPY